MKTISIFLLLLLGAYSSEASIADTSNDKNSVKKTHPVKQALNREVNQHIFFPMNNDANVSGVADVVFEVQPDGTVKVASISTNNDALKQFIIRQAEKMVIWDDVCEGQQVMYRFVFRRQA